MCDPRPQELIHAEELLNNGKVDEGIEIITNFEKNCKMIPKERLWTLLLRGRAYVYKQQFKKGVEIGEQTYKLSNELGLVLEIIEALILKSQIAFLGKLDEALDLILKAEKLFNSLREEPSTDTTKLKIMLNYMKSWIYIFKSDFNIALDLALEVLTLGKKINFKVLVGYSLGTIATIYSSKGEYDPALEYAFKCLKLFEKLDFQIGVAHSHWLIGHVYSLNGNLNRALEFCEKCLSMEKIKGINRVQALYDLGKVYMSKGELNKALQYTEQSAEIAKEIFNIYFLVLIRHNIGEIFRRKGEIDKAIEYYKQSLVLSEKMGNMVLMMHSLLSLLLVNIDKNSSVQAQKYLKRLENLSDKHKSTRVKHAYLLGQAIMLKMSNRMADHTDAARLLKQIVEDDIYYPLYHLLAIVSLCDLLLKELSMYNNLEIIDEINPLIIKLFRIAENQHSYSWLAEGKLLQAKLALIQINIEGAKKLLTEAQDIAKTHGLILLSQKISKEHDNLLEQLDQWQTLKRNQAPISDRVKLASVDDVIGRLEGKRAVEPPEIIEEEPILLLIMSEGGITYFNHIFVPNWDHSDLFSSFLSAFNTFSGEFFSKSIDRIRIGENTILINPVEPFLACYVIKGQSYPALQKLSRFTEAVKENSEIWEALEKSAKTSEMLELDKPPALKRVIDEIFI
ncbi:MAG: tetratricopeptide repeat protein [Candidatus Hermodarchaeota archaeon]